MRIARSKGFTEYIPDTHDFEHGPARSACDQTGTFGCRLEQHLAGAVVPKHLVRNGITFERNLDHGLFGSFDCLFDGYRRFSCLAFSHADLPLAVTNDHQRAEIEALAALDNLGHA